MHHLVVDCALGHSLHPQKTTQNWYSGENAVRKVGTFGNGCGSASDGGRELHRGAHFLGGVRGRRAFGPRERGCRGPLIITTGIARVNIGHNVSPRSSDP